MKKVRSAVRTLEWECRKGREGKGSRTRGVCLAIGVDEQQRSCRALCHQHIRFAVTGQISDEEASAQVHRSRRGRKRQIRHLRIELQRLGTSAGHHQIRLGVVGQLCDLNIRGEAARLKRLGCVEGSVSFADEVRDARIVGAGHQQIELAVTVQIRVNKKDFFVAEFLNLGV